MRDRLQSAGLRALDGLRSIRRRAEGLNEDIDEVTDHGLRAPTTELGEEDSAVIVVDEVRHEIAAASDRVAALVAVK